MNRHPKYRDTRSIAGAAFLGFIASLTLTPALAQVNNPAYADYFLVGRFGEICTMCEAVVMCEAGENDTPHDAIPAEGSFKLYYLQTRTFWSQIATIWEWFVANFNSSLSHQTKSSSVARLKD